MRRHGLVVGLLLACAPAVSQAQSVSLASANVSGDCTATSFHQGADASGKYLAAEWAVAGQFPVGVNRGRVRCTIRYTVTVPTGHKLVPGGMSGSAHRIALAQLSPLRLNGASTGILVESAFSIDVGAPVNTTATYNSGPQTGATLSLDRAVGAPAFESVCSTASKSSFQLSAALELATASNYVMPWPPEPYAEREQASVRGYRLFYTVVPCPTVRTAVPSGLTERP